jgi:predicted transcriptional regulator
MVDLKLHVPQTDEIEVDDETLSEIDRRIAVAETGRAVSIEEARKLIPEWISKFESRKRR